MNGVERAPARDAVDASVAIHRVPTDVSLARMTAIAARAHAEIAVTAAVYDAMASARSVAAARALSQSRASSRAVRLS